MSRKSSRSETPWSEAGTHEPACFSLLNSSCSKYRLRAVTPAPVQYCTADTEAMCGIRVSQKYENTPLLSSCALPRTRNSYGLSATTESQGSDVLKEGRKTRYRDGVSFSKQKEINQSCPTEHERKRRTQQQLTNLLLFGKYSKYNVPSKCSMSNKIIMVPSQHNDKKTSKSELHVGNTKSAEHSSYVIEKIPLARYRSPPPYNEMRCHDEEQDAMQSNHILEEVVKPEIIEKMENANIKSAMEESHSNHEHLHNDVSTENQAVSSEIFCEASVKSAHLPDACHSIRENDYLHVKESPILPSLMTATFAPVCASEASATSRLLVDSNKRDSERTNPTVTTSCTSTALSDTLMSSSQCRSRSNSVSIHIIKSSPRTITTRAEAIAAGTRRAQDLYHYYAGQGTPLTQSTIAVGNDEGCAAHHANKCPDLIRPHHVQPVRITGRGKAKANRNRSLSLSPRPSKCSSSKGRRRRNTNSAGGSSVASSHLRKILYVCRVTRGCDPGDVPRHDQYTGELKRRHADSNLKKTDQIHLTDSLPRDNPFKSYDLASLSTAMYSVRSRTYNPYCSNAAKMEQFLVERLDECSLRPSPPQTFRVDEIAATDAEFQLPSPRQIRRRLFKWWLTGGPKRPSQIGNTARVVQPQRAHQLHQNSVDSDSTGINSPRVNVKMRIPRHYSGMWQWAIWQAVLGRVDPDATPRPNAEQKLKSKTRILALIQRLREAHQLRQSQELATKKIKELHALLVPPSTALLSLAAYTYSAHDASCSRNCSPPPKMFAALGKNAHDENHVQEHGKTCGTGDGVGAPQQRSFMTWESSPSDGAQTRHNHDPKAVADYCRGPLESFISDLFRRYAQFSFQLSSQVDANRCKNENRRIPIPASGTLSLCFSDCWDLVAEWERLHLPRTDDSSQVTVPSSNTKPICLLADSSRSSPQRAAPSTVYLTATTEDLVRPHFISNLNTSSHTHTQRVLATGEVCAAPAVLSSLSEGFSLQPSRLRTLDKEVVQAASEPRERVIAQDGKRVLVEEKEEEKVYVRQLAHDIKVMTGLLTAFFHNTPLERQSYTHHAADAKPAVSEAAASFASKIINNGTKRYQNETQPEKAHRSCPSPSSAIMTNPLYVNIFKRTKENRCRKNSSRRLKTRRSSQKDHSNNDEMLPNSSAGASSHSSSNAAFYDTFFQYNQEYYRRKLFYFLPGATYHSVEGASETMSPSISLHQIQNVDQKDALKGEDNGGGAESDIFGAKRLLLLSQDALTHSVFFVIPS